jgi:hypothetical protein
LPAFDLRCSPAVRVLTRPRSARLLECQAVNFRALLHRRVRSAEARCQASTPYSSMGFVPLRGPSPPLLFRRTLHRNAPSYRSNHPFCDLAAEQARVRRRRSLSDGSVCSAFRALTGHPKVESDVAAYTADPHGVSYVKDQSDLNFQRREPRPSFR